MSYFTTVLKTVALGAAIGSATAGSATARADAKKTIIKDLQTTVPEPSPKSSNVMLNDLNLLKHEFVLKNMFDLVKLDPGMIISNEQTLEGNKGLLCDSTEMDRQNCDPNLPKNKPATVTTARCMTNLDVALQMLANSQRIYFENGIACAIHSQETKPTPEVIKDAGSFYVKSYEKDGNLIEHEINFPKNSKFTGSIIEIKTLNNRPKEGGAVSVKTESGEKSIGIIIEVVEEEPNEFKATIQILDGLENKNKNEL